MPEPGCGVPQNGRVAKGTMPHAAAGDRQLEVATALRQILDLAGDATAGNSSSGGSGESRAACIAYVDAVQRLLEANVAYVAEVRQPAVARDNCCRCTDPVCPVGPRPGVIG